jgi:hypothetical protein
MGIPDHREPRAMSPLAQPALRLSPQRKQRAMSPPAALPERKSSQWGSTSPEKSFSQAARRDYKAVVDRLNQLKEVPPSMEGSTPVAVGPPTASQQSGIGSNGSSPPVTPTISPDSSRLYQKPNIPLAVVAAAEPPSYIDSALHSSVPPYSAAPGAAGTSSSPPPYIRNPISH